MNECLSLSLLAEPHENHNSIKEDDTAHASSDTNDTAIFLIAPLTSPILLHGFAVAPLEIELHSSLPALASGTPLLRARNLGLAPMTVPVGSKQRSIDSVV